MAQIKLEGLIDGIDEEATLADLDKTMVKFVTEQLKIWVTKTTQPIPVWSGASRASFIKLADQAKVQIQINPVAPIPPGDRRILGINTSKGEIFRIPGDLYGWEWVSDLNYIEIVEDRVKFIEAGLRSIQRNRPELPQPKLKQETETIK